ncbi:MAG: hypothetical protein ACRDYA_16030 [Egibacteraceae bacterium]
MARYERSLAIAVATVALAAVPASAVPVPYDVEVQTVFGQMEGTVTRRPDAVSWDLEVKDTNKADGACVYARLVVERPDNTFRSKDACFGKPVRFTGKDPGDHDGLTLDFCARKPGATGQCIRVLPPRLSPPQSPR